MNFWGSRPKSAVFGSQNFRTFALQLSDVSKHFFIGDKLFEKIFCNFFFGKTISCMENSKRRMSRREFRIIDGKGKYGYNIENVSFAVGIIKIIIFFKYLASNHYRVSWYEKKLNRKWVGWRIKLSRWYKELLAKRTTNALMDFSRCILFYIFLFLHRLYEYCIEFSTLISMFLIFISVHIISMPFQSQL